MTYVIESGIAEHGTPQNWWPLERHDDKDAAYDRMVSFALASRPGLYEPYGNRKLRVREIKP
jgi:hypothetical protein